MHHLILVREIDSYAPTATGPPPGGVPLRPWDGSSLLDPAKRERIDRIGEVYRAVRASLADQVEITVIDPRNLISFLSLIARDAVRYRVPVATALRSLLANRASAGILDGQVLFEGTPPSPDEAVEVIRGRLTVHRA